MISYTKRYVNIVSILLTTIIFIIINNINFNLNPQSILNIFKKNAIQVEMNSNNINTKTNDGI